MKRLIILSLVSLSACVSLLLSGCATTGKYNEKLASWSGRDVNDLIASWGMPAQTMDMPNGGKAYEYYQGNRSVANTTYNPYTGLQTTGVSYYCKTTFFTNSLGMVQSWHWEGNSCASY